MARTRVIGVALLAIGVVACGDTPGGSLTGPADGPALASSAIPTTTYSTASGFVKVNLFGYADTYSFDAVNKLGNVTGTFQWQSDQPNGEISLGSGRVVCLTVVDNVAHLGGELQPDDLAWAPPPFNHVVWTVVDNGRRPRTAPDFASLMIAFKTREQVEAHCLAGNLAIAPLDDGDVKVRGGLPITGLGRAGNE